MDRQRVPAQIFQSSRDIGVIFVSVQIKEEHLLPGLSGNRTAFQLGQADALLTESIKRTDQRTGFIGGDDHQ